ncbi:MAG: pyruvate dehydrogenase (acetyl-transferring) E1 component subunit alpha [Bacteroidetes bacterium]|nr:pyruvate dehydrogenase (acetyl-transferring) E1 component subunit alpha [Bacteroidota bacterium]
MESQTLKNKQSELEQSKNKFLDLSNDQLIEMYKKMLLIRRFEERCAQEYGKGKIAGFCHLYIGQEAVAVGTIQALNKEDYIYASYRDHGQALARGLDPKKIMAELFGKFTGTTKGVGGSMHLIDADKNFMGGYGIVGGHIPLAAGAAFTAKYKTTGGVAVCYFGEAAINQGIFFETLNMAQIWKLPVIFIIENNRYGMGTSIKRVFAGEKLYDTANYLDMNRNSFNGMDVLDSYNVMKSAVELARKKSLPTLLEAQTYRFRGHSMSDPATYRTKEEVELEKGNDPISIFLNQLLENKVTTQNNLDEIEIEIKKIVADSVEFAENSEQPPIEFLTENVYTD